ncbi:MAG: hypothetical protein P8046_11535, partial [Anaerolineales bacterium]
MDLGFGADPTIALESAAHLRKSKPELKLLGVELDPERVAEAKPFEDSLTLFRHGGFNIPLPNSKKTNIIRAFNVLRQYEENQVTESYEVMEQYLMPGGTLIEGTSDPY